MFNANCRELGLADTIPTTLLPQSLIRDGNLTLDEFDGLLDTPAKDGVTTIRRQVEWTNAIVSIGGHLRSSYPVGAAVMAVPVYAALGVVHPLRSFDDFRLAGKLSASLIVALSAGFVFLSLRRFCRTRAALTLATFYAFGTTAWTIASQALWQHGPGMLCFAIAIWLWLGLRERDRAWEAFVFAAALSFAVVCRPQNAIGAALLAAAGLYVRPRRWAWMAVPAVVLGAALVWYNLTVFDNLVGGYAELYQSQAHGWRGLGPENVFTYPLSAGIPSVLVSPSKGLFVYTPLMVVAFVMVAVQAIVRPTPLVWAILLWTASAVVLFAKNRLWWGGTSYGPRYFSELMPALILVMAMGWQLIERSLPRLGLVVALGWVGVSIQLVGALTWPCGWHASPTWIDFDLRRLWDFEDPEIDRCLRQLASEGPKSPDLLGAFAGPR